MLFSQLSSRKSIVVFLPAGRGGEECDRRRRREERRVWTWLIRRRSEMLYCFNRKDSVCNFSFAKLLSACWITSVKAQTFVGGDVELLLLSFTNWSQTQINLANRAAIRKMMLIWIMCSTRVELDFVNMSEFPSRWPESFHFVISTSLNATRLRWIQLLQTVGRMFLSQHRGDTRHCPQGFKGVVRFSHLTVVFSLFSRTSGTRWGTFLWSGTKTSLTLVII